MTMTILHTSGPDAELEGRLGEELRAFNTRATAGHERGGFTVKVTAPDGVLVGGLTAWTWGDCAGVELLWVDDAFRQEGWGGKLLAAAEAEAGRRGCRTVTVSTYSFQAPGFYAAHGYRETARVPGVPGGHEDIYFIKFIEFIEPLTD
ncbi:GNAT family N-acetyltransferase [Streptomyces sp. NBC_00536]|uniref:GNAT family N-acetyltransferase n=1 Tax=Streptomyces sp. NBC_00536 TaxID=2975769 RepID=UPI002E80E0EF|nr:GNAT family N-acetyltransferase [Streptomyces sp. NBC_00536]WUC80554.1 GNAT family N-acetyltransferase [Streptomyces sp. NBC_00536]